MHVGNPPDMGLPDGYAMRHFLANPVVKASGMTDGPSDNPKTSQAASIQFIECVIRR